MTVGVKSSFTPNGLNCTVITGAVAPPVGVVVMVGKGNDPPARKLASLPSCAIRFGSARICSRLRSCSALMVAPKLMSGRNANRFKQVGEIHRVAVGLSALHLQLAEARRVELLRGERAHHLVVGAEQIEADLREGDAIHCGELHL